MGTTRPGTGVGVPMSVIRLPAPFGQRNNITPAPVDTMRLTVDNLRLLMTNCGQPATRCGLLPIKCKIKKRAKPAKILRQSVPDRAVRGHSAARGAFEPPALRRCRAHGDGSAFVPLQAQRQRERPRRGMPRGSAPTCTSPGLLLRRHHRRRLLGSCPAAGRRRRVRLMRGPGSAVQEFHVLLFTPSTPFIIVQSVPIEGLAR